jgi:DNA-binding transcriptional ArsR family regulator
MPDEEGQVPRVSRCNCFSAKKGARRLSLMYDTVLAPVRLKSSQYGILSELHSRGAALPTVRELAEELVMDRSTLGQNLRPLERDELITLLTDPKDRRNRLIALTNLVPVNCKPGRYGLASKLFEILSFQPVRMRTQVLVWSLARKASKTFPNF